MFLEGAVIPGGTFQPETLHFKFDKHKTFISKIMVSGVIQMLARINEQSHSNQKP